LRKFGFPDNTPSAIKSMAITNPINVVMNIISLFPI